MVIAVVPYKAKMFKVSSFGSFLWQNIFCEGNEDFSEAKTLHGGARGGVGFRVVSFADVLWWAPHVVMLLCQVVLPHGKKIGYPHCSGCSTPPSTAVREYLCLLLDQKDGWMLAIKGISSLWALSHVNFSVLRCYWDTVWIGCLMPLHLFTGYQQTWSNWKQIWRHKCYFWNSLKWLIQVFVKAAALDVMLTSCESCVPVELVMLLADAMHIK